MSKLIWVVPVCITFGPLLATNMAGLYPEGGASVAVPGVLMLMSGLLVMYDIMCKNVNKIESITNNGNAVTPRTDETTTH